jgi:hypothetical protein
MPTLQIRIDEDSLALIKERGGSPWARGILLEALGPPVAELELKPAEELETPQFDGLCPRWMHHRFAEPCPVCGESL